MAFPQLSYVYPVRPGPKKGGWGGPRNLGTVYNQLRDHDKAKVYFDAAAELVGERDANGQLILDKEEPAGHAKRTGLKGLKDGYGLWGYSMI